MRVGIIVFLMLANWLSAALLPQSAQSEVQDVAAFYRYGENVTFQARLTSIDQIDQAYLMIQPEGESTRIEELAWNSAGEVLYTYDVNLHPLRPFGRTYYWFRLVTRDSEITTPSYWFDYIDNRFTWQSLTNDYFEIHWQDQDLTFGQTALNTAQSSLNAVQKILPIAPEFPLKIYIYSEAEDLQTALTGLSESWVAGQASPDLGVILLSISQGPDQTLELERQLPHEMMHIMEYSLVGDQYNNTPVWLTEGIASIAELYPNADYERVLNTAIAEDELLSFENLCNTFPRDAGSAFLAYSQSTSFVRYIYQTYGSTGLTNLLRQYQTGLGCEEGVQATLGKSLTELENDWRQSNFSVDPTSEALKSLSPYLILALLVLIVPLGLVWIHSTRQEKPGE
jgi:hypothetical protein